MSEAISGRLLRHMSMWFKPRGATTGAQPFDLEKLCIRVVRVILQEIFVLQIIFW